MTDERHDEEATRRLDQLGELKPTPEATRRALDRVRHALGESTPPVPSSPRRRYLMRVVVPSTAALVLLGGAALFLLTTTPAPTLADVVKAAEKHKLVKYKQTQTTDTKDGVSGTTESVVYADLKSPRSRSESRVLTLNGAVESVSVQIGDGAKGRFLATLSETVVPGEENNPRLGGLTFPRKEATLQGGDPGTEPKKKQPSFLDHLRELEQHKGAVVTKDKVGSREAIKYSLEDGKKTTQLWVDRETKLPLRFEWEILDHTPDISRNKWVYADFEWDPGLPKGVKDLDALFDTTPPEGYKLDDQTRNDKR